MSTDNNDPNGWNIKPSAPEINFIIYKLKKI